MLLQLLELKILYLGKLIVKMYSRNLITTDGSSLCAFSSKKAFYFLKKDPMNHNLWKSIKKNSSVNRMKKLEIFKSRFLKN
jgi:hypothetical protein